MTHPLIATHPAYQAWSEESERLKATDDAAKSRLLQRRNANDRAETEWRAAVEEARAAGRADPEQPVPPPSDYLDAEQRAATFALQQHREAQRKVLAEIADELLPQLVAAFAATAQKAQKALDAMDRLHGQARDHQGAIIELLAAQEHADPDRQIVGGASTQIRALDFERFVLAARGADVLTAVPHPIGESTIRVDSPEDLPMGRVHDRSGGQPLTPPLPPEGTPEGLERQLKAEDLLRRSRTLGRQRVGGRWR